ncbi:DgyrCDS12032 [Dimorphilus gyrociliatus]|uniref:DNA ligase n=1 Tax=Dimorphilus gyrociliatus TaxID=2664684 RepID=A0A7I8W732_9ANNE|nr:DgyrCDS12032 [Dimorphilus gyrociliatus]
MSRNEIEMDYHPSWSRQASRMSTKTSRSSETKPPIGKRVINGISEFFGVVDTDPAENESWKNRKIRLASSHGKLDSGKGEDYLNKGYYDTTDNVFLSSPTYNRDISRKSEEHKVYRGISTASGTYKRCLSSQKQRRGRTKESVLKMTVNGIRNLTTPVKKSERKPRMHSRSFTPASLSSFHEDYLVDSEKSRLSITDALFEDGFFRVATPTSPLPTNTLNQKISFQPKTIPRRGEGDVVDSGGSRLIAPEEARPVKAGWQIGRSKPADVPDTPFDFVDSPFAEMKKITSNMMDSALKSNEKRSVGVGFVGRCFGREYKKGVDRNEDIRKQIDEMDLYRPYFTYWVCTVQILVFIVAVSVYGFAPIGFSEKEIKGEVITVSLAYHQVSYFEKENLWIGPRTADLIHLGSKYSPCMRKDESIESGINKAREIEKNTACCIRNDDSGCVQTDEESCSNILSSWQKWTKDKPGSQGLTSGSVCGQDPELCDDPASSGSFKWKDDITTWPICKSTRNASKSDATKRHMTCGLVGRPCCLGVKGKCMITTREYCDFKRGYFHEEATLCSQVSCMNEICGMIDFWDPNRPDQFYRLFTSLFLHGGVVQLIITLLFQFFIMRDLEKLAGWLRIGIIYIGSGIAGSLMSAIFLPYYVEAGPSGSQFGLLACLFVEVFQSWQILASPWKSLLKLGLILLVLFIVGLLPMIDNYAHIAGFFFGLLLAFALLPYLKFGKFDKTRKLITIIVSLLIAIVPFEELAGLLEKISRKSGTETKKDLLRLFFEKWRASHQKIHEDDKDSKDSVYPAMRLMLPQLERERDAYGMKEHTLGKYYIDILGLGGSSAKKLLNYRAPTNKKGTQDSSGDFAAVAYFILKSRLPEKGDLSISEVNDQLDKISHGHANKEKSQIKNALTFLLTHTSPLQHKWLIRMLLKDMKIGMSQTTILNAYHKDADDLFNVKMNLREVCELLREPSKHLHEIEVSLFAAFRPMLADRAQPQNALESLNTPLYYIETKYDGERIQLHKDGDEYRYFSRNGHDYTLSFGKTPYDGSLTPYISHCWPDDIETVILDGEMVGYDSTTKTIGSKADSFDVKSASGEGDLYPCFVVFDILLKNKKVLTNLPLRERKKELEGAFCPIDGRIVLTVTAEATSNNECIKALNDAIDNRYEGIMIKSPESVYKPHSRKAGWFKIKPEYVGGLMDELDVLVVGGSFGSGHRSGILSHFLCAVADTEGVINENTVFHSFCKVGSGYSQKELLEFNRKIKDHVKDAKKGIPSWLELASGRQKPDCIIEPSKSAILQIKAAEIVESDQYRTGCTLRFPRVMKIRDDKSWTDSMTVEELKQLQKQGKLYGKKHMEEDDGLNFEDEPKTKRRRGGGTKRIVKPTVAAHLRGVDVDTVEKLDELLLGKEFCVVNAERNQSKIQLESDIVAHGGTAVQHPGENTWCCLAAKTSVRVKNMIASKQHDIVKVEWLLSCFEQQKLLSWSPKDMIFAKSITTNQLAERFDEHGDSFTSDINDIDCLKDIFRQVKSTCRLNYKEIAEVEEEYFPHDCRYGLFRLCTIYGDSYEVLSDENTARSESSLPAYLYLASVYGANISSRLDKSVTHVIVENDDHFNDLNIVNRSRRQKFRIVRKDWIDECVKEGKLLDESNFKA